jgi:hypothetical protein
MTLSHSIVRIPHCLVSQKFDWALNHTRFECICRTRITHNSKSLWNTFTNRILWFSFLTKLTRVLYEAKFHTPLCEFHTNLCKFHTNLWKITNNPMYKSHRKFCIHDLSENHTRILRVYIKLIWDIFHLKITFLTTFMEVSSS